DAAGDGIELQLIDVVQDVDHAPAELDRPGVRIDRRPIGSIDIALDRYHRRNPVKAGNHLRPADIAGVDDMGDAGEAPLSLGAQQAVGVRYDSDPHPALAQSSASAIRRINAERAKSHRVVSSNRAADFSAAKRLTGIHALSYGSERK